jgi:hypothetical protein
MLKDKVNGKLLAGFMFLFAIYLILEGAENLQTGKYVV